VSCEAKHVFGSTFPCALAAFSSSFPFLFFYLFRNQTIRGWSQRSIFKALSDANVDWRVYMEEASTAFLMQDMRTLSAIEKMKNINQFYTDAAAGNLPPFSFIDPAYFTIPSIVNASDQHPSHDVLDGERLIKKIYEALRASPDWENSVLVATYDEHGGFYDHVSPPSNVPNPDGLPCNDCDMPFNFDRLGVRVPFLVISAWVQKGQVISEAPAHVKPYPTSQMEHSSLSATLHRLFPNITGPGPNNFLTKRDAWAAPFDFIWTESGITTPRTDCPMTLPEVPVGGYFATPEGQKKLDGTAPLTPLQREWLHMMHGTLLDGKVTPADVDAMIDAQGLHTEAAAGLWIREMTEMKLKKAASVKN
jgi:Phosphoesterase family